jgi:ferredoxin
MRDEGGRYAVDATRCIRCAACSTLAPGLFALRGDGAAAVVREPRDEDERVLAQAAQINCPAAAITSGRRDE